jgi:murein DD-endopeptidase MepM/ murein hydrolase activator NlpD
MGEADDAASPTTLARFVFRRGPKTGRMLAAASAVALVCASTAAHAATLDPAGRVRPFSVLSEAASRPAWLEQAERRRLAERGGAAPAFPVVGPHDYGTAENRFGGVRDHGGQDVLAPCGEPVVAVLGGKVTDVKYEGAAGNYAVVRAADGTSQVYMHLRDAASVRPGERIASGKRIGRVGQTGDASTCHLHFELWTAPGWYAGGRAIDPLPALRRWDSAAR